MGRDSIYKRYEGLELSIFLTVRCRFSFWYKMMIAISIALSAFSAHAEDPFEQNLKYLKKNGVSQIAGTSIDELIAKGAFVKIRVVDSVQFLGNEGSIRHSAKWDSSKNEIHFSRRHLANMDPAHVAGLFTHEKCQLLTQGTCDENFRASALIEALKSQEAIQKRNPTLYGKKLEPSDFSIDFQKVSGGVTGVGGGGDVRIQDYLKAFYLHLFFLICRSQMSINEFHQIYDILGIFNLQMDPQLAQGTLRLDQEKKVLFIPKDAMLGPTFDVNQNAIETLSKSFLKSIRGAKP